MASTVREKIETMHGYVPDEKRLNAIVAKHKKVFDQIDKDNMP